MHEFLLVALLLLVIPGTTADDGAFPDERPAAHDFHVSYGRMAVEGRQAVCRIRFFKDDLEAALQQFHGEPAFRLDANPRGDALFLAYLSTRFVLQHKGTPLEGRISRSGEEEDGREKMWWYVIQFEADEDIEALKVEYTLLFDYFEDQKNIFKVMHYPSEEVQSFYYAEGAEVFEIAF
jgi:hypothetical protein